MELAAPKRREGGVDGLAAEVVAEGLAAVVVDEQPGSQALVDGGAVAVAHDQEEGGARVVAEDGGGVEGVAGGAAEGHGAAEDQVAHRLGELAGRGGQRLHQEEGVAAGAGVQRLDVDVPVVHEGADGVDRQRGASARRVTQGPTSEAVARRIG